MIRIKQIKIPLEDYNKDNLKKYIAKKIKCIETDIKEIHIKKQSLDARKKESINYIFEVDIEINNEKKLLNKYKNSLDIMKTPNEEYVYPPSVTPEFNQKIVIVGSGPAGLFCAYILAELGYNPIIIERGEKIEKRIKSVEKFWETGILN